MRREILDCGRAYWVTTDRHRDFAKWSARDQQPHLALRSSSTLTRDVRSNSSGGQTVTVMQATKSWHGYDSATHIRVLLWFTTRRCSLVQCKMRSIFVVVKNVLVQQALQMPFIQHDHMVEQITTAAADPTLANTVLPWTSETGPLGWMPKLFIVPTTSSLKLAPRSKIR